MPRKYQLKRRAEKQEQTRRRILDAVVELHEVLGPAQTTISAIAEKAGVQRLTVYRHFPDEPALFRACSTHWLAKNPLPDPETWLAVADPRDRLRRGLRDLYAYYERTEQMQANVLRDMSLSPTIAQVQQPFLSAFRRIHLVLSENWRAQEARQPFVVAALSHAIAFETWRSLVRQQGLSTDQAVELIVCLLGCAAGDSCSP